MVLAVEIVTAGTDRGQLSPMVKQVGERCRQTPANWLVDGGYPGHGQLDAVAESTSVYAPVPRAKDPKRVHARSGGRPALANVRDHADQG